MEKVIFTLFIGKSYIKLFLHETDNVADFEKVWPVQVLEAKREPVWIFLYQPVQPWLLWFGCYTSVT